MAKRKAAKKKTAKKKTKPAKARMRQPALPGHEQVRNVKLDRHCEDIFDARQEKNNATLNERGALQGALTEMANRNIPSYTAHGVELVYVKGMDKLRARVVDDTGVAGIGQPTDAGDEPEASGDDFSEAAEG